MRSWTILYYRDMQGEMLIKCRNDSFCYQGDDMQYSHSCFMTRHQHQASGSERLFALATFVETLSPNVVTFGCWYRNGAGCVIGLAAKTNAWFRAQGLRLENLDQPQSCHPVYRNHTDWNAIAAFFELDVATCRDLFTAAGYDGEIRPQPRRIAARIWTHLDRQDVSERRLGRSEGVWNSDLGSIHA